jgi:hypothetical protein
LKSGSKTSASTRRIFSFRSAANFKTQRVRWLNYNVTGTGSDARSCSG